MVRPSGGLGVPIPKGNARKTETCMCVCVCARACVVGGEAWRTRPACVFVWMDELLV